MSRSSSIIFIISLVWGMSLLVRCIILLVLLSLVGVFVSIFVGSRGIICSSFRVIWMVNFIVVILLVRVIIVLLVLVYIVVMFVVVVVVVEFGKEGREVWVEVIGEFVDVFLGGLGSGEILLVVDFEFGVWMDVVEELVFWNNRGGGDYGFGGGVEFGCCFVCFGECECFGVFLVVVFVEGVG